jgi:serine protease AprX
MRYAVISKGLDLTMLKSEVMKVGAASIKESPLLNQIFCEMDEKQARDLSKTPGLRVKLVGSTYSDQITSVSPPAVVSPPETITPPAVETLQAEGLNLYDTFGALRRAYKPALDGAGLTVAVVDSGIRKTHEALIDKVIYEANFSDSSTLDDIFGHGTGVAYLIAGEYEEKSGVATGAKLMNLKALNDDGYGTEEMVVDAIEEVCRLVKIAQEQGLHPTAEMYPNTINISLGSVDDGDPDNPMRAAAKVAKETYGVQVIAAAGNSGPNFTTMMSPATDPDVIAVGGIKTWEFEILEISSRGPTKEGLTKPDFICWAESIEVASHKGDDEYDVKSGTSFSAPIMTGLDGILWDLCRRVYGSDVRITYYDWAQFAYAYCVKPEGAPLAKDNAYGYGLPAISVMISRLMKPATPVAALMDTMVPMMMIVMMMGMMGKIM